MLSAPVALFPSLFSTLFCLGSGLVLQTSYGKVRGAIDHSNLDNLKYSFKAIPFAAPPIGTLRFQKPEKPVSWDGIRDATESGPACMSYMTNFTEVTGVSEDCLFVNIFTSQRCLRKTCPVIVFIHGGSFNAGLATQFNETFLMERYVEEDIVFAIPAFRLGVFGQFYLGDSSVTSPNLLLYDCVAALHFIHSQIEVFGGKPHDLTIFGHSSGGSLVDALAFSHDVDPDQKLFQKQIILSAHGLYHFENILVDNSFDIATRLGCKYESKQKIKNCMQQLNAADILQVQKDMEDNEFLYFKSLLLKDPVVKENGKIADLKRNATPRKMLYGTTQYEFENIPYKNYYVSGYFLDFENTVEVTMTYRNNFTNITSAMMNSDSSSVFVSAATYSQAVVNAGADVWLYESRQKPYTSHTSDMQFFMGVHKEKVHTSDMDIVDKFYSQWIANFTKYGEPSPIWEKLDPSKMNFLVMEIDTKMGIVPHMEEKYHEELINVWLINMTEIDRSITRQKLLNGPANLDALTDTLNVLENEGVPFYNQWWFYVIVLCVFVVLGVVFYILKRSVTEEQRPLLR